MRIAIGNVPSVTRILQIEQGLDNGDWPQADAWTTYSSRRWKENIAPLSNILERILQLRGVRFEWKGTGRRDLGMIAEEVATVLPEVVSYEENGVDASSIDYGRLTAVLVEGIKSQQQQIERLQVEIDALKKAMNENEDEDEPKGMTPCGLPANN